MAMASNTIQESKKPIANITATSRLKNDYVQLMKDPIPYIVAEPLPSNILVWHYVITGPPDSPYAGGFYHGKLKFPKEFPFNPPSIYIITPNGRFEVNKRLCLSISDYHPKTWKPTWTVASILIGLLSFMLEDTPTVGSVKTSEPCKRRYAQDSLRFNLEDKDFVELFPDLAKKSEDMLSMKNSRGEREKSRSKSPCSNEPGILERVMKGLGFVQRTSKEEEIKGTTTNFFSKKDEYARNQLLSNFESLRNDPSDDFTAVPSEENIMIWNAVIFGPQNTPFEDGIFKVTIQFCNEYPYIPPQVKFLSRIFHPNVYPDGSLCPEVLQNGWTPSIQVSWILGSIRSVLEKPNAKCFVNLKAGDMLQNDTNEYNKEVIKCVEETWMDDSKEDDKVDFADKGAAEPVENWVSKNP